MSTEISQVLAQMRVVSAQINTPSQAVSSVAEGSFSDLLSQSINKVNDLQQTSNTLKTAFEQGEDVDLARVMVASQKSSLAFSGMVEVRNKLVEAYKDVMNMPI